MAIARRTAEAEHDLQEIAFHITYRAKRREVARKIVRQIIGECQKLADLAGVMIVGKLAPEIGQDVRVYGFRRWVIIFRYEEDGINVLRIADQSQDYRSWRLE